MRVKWSCLASLRKIAQVFFLCSFVRAYISCNIHYYRSSFSYIFLLPKVCRKLTLNAFWDMQPPLCSHTSIVPQGTKLFNSRASLAALIWELHFSLMHFYIEPCILGVGRSQLLCASTMLYWKLVLVLFLFKLVSKHKQYPIPQWKIDIPIQKKNTYKPIKIDCQYLTFINHRKLNCRFQFESSVSNSLYKHYYDLKTVCFFVYP